MQAQTAAALPLRAPTPAPIATPAPVRKRKPSPSAYISWEDFERKYLTREDAYKYEWVDGVVEKTERSMNQDQLIILRNLRRLFEQLRFSGKVEGDLEAEIDSFFLSKVHRRPDVSWFSEEQQRRLPENQIPQFVIEIISTNDQINKVHRKMRNYRQAGLQVVWHIFPDLQEVHVYSGPELKQMVVCMEEAICSAAPVLPAFELAAKDIFKRPE